MRARRIDGLIAALESAAWMLSEGEQHLTRRDGQTDRQTYGRTLLSYHSPLKTSGSTVVVGAPPRPAPPRAGTAGEGVAVTRQLTNKAQCSAFARCNHRRPTKAICYSFSIDAVGFFDPRAHCPDQQQGPNKYVGRRAYLHRAPSRTTPLRPSTPVRLFLIPKSLPILPLERRQPTGCRRGQDYELRSLLLFWKSFGDWR